MRLPPERQAEVDRRVEVWARRWAPKAFRAPIGRARCKRCGARMAFADYAAGVGPLRVCGACGETWGPEEEQQ